VSVALDVEDEPEIGPWIAQGQRRQCGCVLGILGTGFDLGVEVAELSVLLLSDDAVDLLVIHELGKNDASAFNRRGLEVGSVT
jgi:hypothetical protein